MARIYNVLVNSQSSRDCYIPGDHYHQDISQKIRKYTFGRKLPYPSITKFIQSRLKRSSLQFTHAQNYRFKRISSPPHLNHVISAGSKIYNHLEKHTKCTFASKLWTVRVQSGKRILPTTNNRNVLMKASCIKANISVVFHRETSLA